MLTTPSEQCLFSLSSCQSHLGGREGRREGGEGGRGREGGREGEGGGREGGRERRAEGRKERRKEGGREEGRGYSQEHASCEVLAMYLITQTCMAGEGGGRGEGFGSVQ